MYHSRNVLDKIELSLAYNSLDHKWLSRNWLSTCWEKLRKNESSPNYDSRRIDEDMKCISNPNVIPLLDGIANSAFKYHEKYAKVLKKDPSLSVITELCHDDGLRYNVLQQDDQLFFLSRVFNQIARSTRKLFKCYDCGTNARAIFLKLIKHHRGAKYRSKQNPGIPNDGFYLTMDEQEMLRREYTEPDLPPLECLAKWYSDIKRVKKDTVFIMSLGLDNFGHVWVIEKRFIRGKPRYHQYQTCFRSHMLVDWIEHCNYGKNPDQSLDIDTFYKYLSELFSKTDAWTEEDYAKFVYLFAFIPVRHIAAGNTNASFSYSYITY